MELILWRHADAEDANGKDDQARELTKKGRKQAERMAAWLKPRLHGDWRILVSPAKRTLQTVKPLDLPFDVSEAVGTGTTPLAVIRAADWPRGDRNVLVVGHQPTFGQVAARILGIEDGELAIKKGAIWWLAARAGEDNGEVAIKAVLAPDLLDD